MNLAKGKARISRRDAFLVIALLLFLAAWTPSKVLAQADLDVGKLFPQNLDGWENPAGFPGFIYQNAMRPDPGHGVPGIISPGELRDRSSWQIVWPVSPVVGVTRVGFLNTTDVPVRFVMAVDGGSRVYEMIGREILTVDVPNGASLKATVSTEDKDSTIDLERGAIYLLKTENARWVLARLP